MAAQSNANRKLREALQADTASPEAAMEASKILWVRNRRTIFANVSHQLPIDVSYCTTLDICIHHT